MSLKKGVQASSASSRRLSLVLTSCSLLVGMLHAQQNVAGRTDSTNSSAEHDSLSDLGVQGRALEQRAGVWDVTFTNWSSPGASPEVTSGLVAERRMYGPMLQEVLHPASGSTSDAFTRIDDLTFNRIESRWDYVSFDTRAPVGLMPAWSLQADSPKRIFLSFQPFSMPGERKSNTGQMMRMEQIILSQDADHEVKDQYFMPADGAGTRWLAKRYSYTRRTSGATLGSAPAVPHP